MVGVPPWALVRRAQGSRGGKRREWRREGRKRRGRERRTRRREGGEVGLDDEGGAERGSVVLELPCSPDVCRCFTAENIETD